MSIATRPYETDADVRRMQALASETWRISGPRAEWHVGDLAWGRWHHAGREHEWRIALWEEDGELVAWTWLRLPGTLDWLVHPDHRGGELHARLLDWFERQAEGTGPLRTWTREDDAVTTGLLAEHGYALEADADALALHVRGLTDASEPDAPNGFTLRCVCGREDLPRRVEVHRAAWEPSRVTEESYANVMRAWPYRPELDCVAEAPDGRFAASCLAWLDEENRAGELEPVGTAPAFRRQGLAAAVCRFALARLREGGAETAVVYSNTPPARSLYESIGFRTHSRIVPYVKARVP